MLFADWLNQQDVWRRELIKYQLQSFSWMPIYAIATRTLSFWETAERNEWMDENVAHPYYIYEDRTIFFVDLLEATHFKLTYGKDD